MPLTIYIASTIPPIQTDGLDRFYWSYDMTTGEHHRGAHE